MTLNIICFVDAFVSLLGNQSKLCRHKFIHKSDFDGLCNQKNVMLFVRG